MGERTVAAHAADSRRRHTPSHSHSCARKPQFTSAAGRRAATYASAAGAESVRRAGAGPGAASASGFDSFKGHLDDGDEDGKEGKGKDADVGDDETKGKGRHDASDAGDAHAGVVHGAAGDGDAVSCSISMSVSPPIAASISKPDPSASAQPGSAPSSSTSGSATSSAAPTAGLREMPCAQWMRMRTCVCG
ncbi:hypothetical protein B0H11DRAFT_1337712 [Mycena galericulata]|nr:hypothetical protein B0H11DRAFT_1337712 [Mycena galericulata]